MHETTKYEPHLTARVNTSGMLYVGRKYTGQEAEIYFLKNDKEGKNAECRKIIKDRMEREK